MSDDVITIEQRLQDPPRIAFFSLDEGLMFLFPVGIGLLTRHLIPGVICGIVIWQLWKMVKGDGGLEWLVAASYWFLPGFVSPYKSLPDSSITLWRG